MSGKKCPDIKDMQRMIRRLGVELRSRQTEVRKQDFLLALRERHGNELTTEMLAYGFDQYSWTIGRRAMKDLVAEAEGIFESRQMVLPMSMAHIPVPQALPIKIGGVEKTVTAVFADIEQGDAYTDSLQGNSNACIKKLTDWLSVWTPARKVMFEHRAEGWDFGRALEYLADHDNGIPPDIFDGDDE
jgi:hypothetical protein